MKTVALMVALTLSGCALTVRPLSARWDGATKPACTSSWAPVFNDGAVAFAGALVGAGALVEYTQHRNNQAAQNLMIGGFVVAAVFIAAAAVSEERVSDCRTAEIAWQSTAALRARAAARAAPAPAFFCASSTAAPTVGVCARLRGAADRQGAAVLGGDAAAVRRAATGGRRGTAESPVSEVAPYSTRWPSSSRGNIPRPIAER